MAVTIWGDVFLCLWSRWFCKCSLKDQHFRFLPKNKVDGPLNPCLVSLNCLAPGIFCNAKVLLFLSFNLLEGTPKIPGPTLHFSFTHLALCHDHTLFLQLRTNPHENSNVSRLSILNSVRDHNHINGYKIPCHHLLSPVYPVVTQSDEPLLPMRKPQRSLLLWDPGWAASIDGTKIQRLISPLDLFSSTLFLNRHIKFYLQVLCVLWSKHCPLTQCCRFKIKIVDPPFLKDWLEQEGGRQPKESRETDHQEKAQISQEIQQVVGGSRSLLSAMNCNYQHTPFGLYPKVLKSKHLYGAVLRKLTWLPFSLVVAMGQIQPQEPH